MANRGGRRPGAGRKPNPLKDIKTGAATAARILAELKHEKAIIDLYNGCQDYRLKTHILFRLREDAYGRPRQVQEDKIIFDPNAPLTVEIRHIGRPDHRPPAEAK